MSGLKRTKPTQTEIDNFCDLKESIEVHQMIELLEESHVFTIMKVIHKQLPEKYEALKSPLDNLCSYIYETITNSDNSIYNRSDVPEKDKKEWTKKVCSCEIPKYILDLCINQYNRVCEEKFKMKSDNFSMIIIEDSKNLLDYVLTVFANCAVEDFELDVYFKNEIIPVEPVFNKVSITVGK